MIKATAIFFIAMVIQGFIPDHSPFYTISLNGQDVCDSRSNSKVLMEPAVIEYSKLSVGDSDLVHVNFVTDTYEDKDCFLIIKNSQQDTILHFISEYRARFKLSKSDWNALKKNLPVTVNYSFRNAAKLKIDPILLFIIK